MSNRKREDFQTVFTEPSRTKQAFKEECDVNKIMQRFKKVCGAEYLSKYNAYAGGEFGDFSDVVDYRSAIDSVRQAEATFGALPSIVRRRFGNDPAEFLDFVQDPKNLDEMRSLGLANPKPLSETDEKSVVST